VDKFRIVSEEWKTEAGRIIKQTQKPMESFFRALPVSSIRYAFTYILL